MSSGPREDIVQFRTLGGESSLGWTVDSWQHCIPWPDAGVPQGSESASNERARKSSFKCRRDVLSGHFATVLSHYVVEGAVCVREFFEPGAHKLLSVVRNDQCGRSKVLDPSFGHALRHRRGSLVQDGNAQFVRRAPPHHVAEDNFGAILHTECFAETESPWHRCWKPGFWRMSSSCACRALELSPHVVEDLWPG